MKKVKIEIKNRWTGNVLFKYEKHNNTIKDTLIRRKHLYGANLDGAVIGRNDNDGGFGDIDNAIEEIENKSNLKITKVHENHNCFTGKYKWTSLWKNVIVIIDYKIKENKPEIEVKEMTISEISKQLGYEVKVVKEG